MVFTNGIYCFFEFNMNYSTRISPSKTARMKTNISSKVTDCSICPSQSTWPISTNLFPNDSLVCISSQPEWRLPHAAKMSQVITAQTSVCKRSVSLTSMKSIKHTCKSACSRSMMYNLTDANKETREYSMPLFNQYYI